MNTDNQYVLEDQFAKNVTTQVQPTIDHDQRELQYYHQQKGYWYFIVLDVLRHTPVAFGCLRARRYLCYVSNSSSGMCCVNSSRVGANFNIKNFKVKTYQFLLSFFPLIKVCGIGVDKY